VNTALAADAGVINQDPYGKGWIIKVKGTGGQDGLLDAAGYKALI
jgi:glycine cleavage system H protein